jgi:DNA-binding MarR family transcriptional regulator
MMIPDGTRSQSGQALASSELAAWRGLLRVSVRLRRELDTRLSEGHNLTIGDYDVLVQLAEQHEQRMRMADLADSVLQPRSSLTRIVGGLEARGLIRREGTSDDARGVEAVLTEEGVAVFRRAQVAHHDNVRELFLDRLSDKQLAELAQAWEAVDRDALTPAPDEGNHRT